MTEAELLLLEITKLRTETTALKQLLISLIARSADDSHDPEKYVLTILAPLASFAEALEVDDAMSAASQKTASDLYEMLESEIHSLLRRLS